MDNTSTLTTRQVSVATPDYTFNGPSNALAATLQAACIAFLVVVPTAIVALLVHYADADYAGYNGSSSNCKVAGYPTNIDYCLSSR